MSELEQFIPEIEKLGLTSISEKDKSSIKKIYGSNIFEAPSESEIERALNYLHSPIKGKIERILAKVVLRCGGEFLIEKSSEKIRKLNRGVDTIYPLRVGFPGLVKDNGEGYIDEPKIRTMRPGAERERGHFQHTSFVGVVDDERVLPGAEELRKSGRDELPQLRQIAGGIMSLIGPRGYSGGEVEDTEILIALKDNSIFSEEVRWVLDNYKAIIRRAQPRPGILSMMSGYNSKNTPHMVRMWLDTIYVQNASPFLDVLIVYRTAIRRGLQGIGAG